jgi:hypothetical protein
MSWRVTTGGNAPQTVERLLRALPQWFGIEASNAAYVEAARHLPAYLAWPAPRPSSAPDGGPVGAAVGFTPLEELHGVWDPENPCLIMIKHLAPGGGPRLPRPG